MNGMVFGSLCALAGVLVAIATIEGPNSPSLTTLSKTADDAATRYEEAEAAFKRMSPGEHLYRAQSQIRSDSTMNEIFDGRKDLAAIPQTAPEYKSVRTLLAASNDREAVLDKESAARVLAEEIEKTPLVVVKSAWSLGGFGTVA